MDKSNFAAYNPTNLPLESLPIVYGFNNGGEPGWYIGQLLAEDGTSLGSHICSSEGFMYQDLGILKNTRPDRHEIFKKHYPNGYRMDFVKECDVKKHAGIEKAYQLNQQLA